MKYKAKDYAKVLVDLVLSKKAGSKIIDNFLNILNKNGDMKKAKEIIFLAENLYSKKTSNRKIILETARKINIKDISEKISKVGDAVLGKVNPGLVAGIKIMINNEKQLDFSLERKLENIFESR